MSNIANDDLFVVRRNGVLYKVYASQVTNGSTLDQYLVQRSGTLYNVEKQNLYDDLQNTDHMMIWDTSVGQLCKVSGQDARTKFFPVYNLDFLTIAGGGSAGNAATNQYGNGGNGGAGGMVEDQISVTGRFTATIVVGAGGVKPTSGDTQGADGGISTLDITSQSGAHLQAYAYGGGGGGAGGSNATLNNGRDGGSGGAGANNPFGPPQGVGGSALSGANYTTYGFAGEDGIADYGGSNIGGGAGSDGASGGASRASSITGTSVNYAAGGGSAEQKDRSNPVTIGSGGNVDGYDGIVIIRWPNAQGNITLNTGDSSGMTVTLDGSDRIAQFTKPGTYTVSVG